MLKKNALFVFVLHFLLSVQAMALVEARISYGSLASQQGLADTCQGSCAAPADAPAIIPTFGLGLDAIVSLPVLPFGVGLRFENMRLATSAANIETELKYQRTALLLNYRLIDTLVHFGPIASLGLGHSGHLVLKESGNIAVELSPSTFSSYSVGLELTAKPLVVLPLILGAEAGYMSFKWGDTTNTIDNSIKNLNLSGTYLKVFLGLDF